MLDALRIRQAAVCGLQHALLAPPISAAIVLAFVTLKSSEPSVDQSPIGSFLFFAFISVAAAYFLGAVPAFAAGTALPTLRRALGPTLASVLTGLLGTTLYLSALAFLPIKDSDLLGYAAVHGLTAFVGVTGASLLISRGTVEA
jgi:hypothetical protein